MRDVEVTMLLGLAPMEGITDLAMRLWYAAIGGWDTATTPFLRVTSTYPSDGVSPLFCPDRNVVPQLMGPNIDDLCRVADELLRHHDFVELNCGCPSPTVVGHGSGSALLQHPDYFQNFITQLSGRLGAKKLAVKMRLGFEKPDEFETLLACVENIPLARLTIHGRTRKQRYLGYAEWAHIHMASQQLSIPIWGSGDITSEKVFQEKTKNQLLTGVFIGRGALRNPWIFWEIKHKKPTSIEADILKLSFEALALLQDLSRKSPDELLKIEPIECGQSKEKWQIFKLHILQKTSASLDLSKGSLARLKLVWSYMRSGLPQEFFASPILRTQTIEDFFSCFNEILVTFQKNTADEEFEGCVPLRYHPEYDWIYAGGKQS